MGVKFPDLPLSTRFEAKGELFKGAVLRHKSMHLYSLVILLSLLVQGERDSETRSYRSILNIGSTYKKAPDSLPQHNK